MMSLDVVRSRFARNEGLPFADILTEDKIRDVLNERGVQFRESSRVSPAANATAGARFSARQNHAGVISGDRRLPRFGHRAV